MNKTIWERIFEHLNLDGFSVYAPLQKQGEAESPYIVVKNAGLIGHPTYSADQVYYDMLCYIPYEQYRDIESFITSVKASLNKIYPLIRTVNFETEPFLDDGVKAYMVSIRYVNYRKRVRG